VKLAAISFTHAIFWGTTSNYIRVNPRGAEMFDQLAIEDLVEEINWSPGYDAFLTICGSECYSENGETKTRIKRRVHRVLAAHVIGYEPLKQY